VTAAADYRRCLVDVDATHGCWESGVAGVVNAVAGVLNGLTSAFAAYGGTDDGGRRDAGLDCAGVCAAGGDCDVAVGPSTRAGFGAAEGDRDFAVVPAVGVC